jgi:hypothetical protein
MSDIVQKKQKTYNVGIYTAVVYLDDKVFESVVVESRSPEAAFEKFIRWYSLWRSKYFDAVKSEDIDPAVDEIENLGTDPAFPLLLGSFQTQLPSKRNEEGEVTDRVTIKCNFYERIVL